MGLSALGLAAILNAAVAPDDEHAFRLLLNQVYSDQEAMGRQLEKELRNLKEARDLLRRQIAKLAELDYDVELIAIRVQQVLDRLDASEWLVELEVALERMHSGLALAELNAPQSFAPVLGSTAAKTAKMLERLKEATTPDAGHRARARVAVTNLLRGLQNGHRPRQGFNEAIDLVEEFLRTVQVLRLSVEGGIICGPGPLRMLHEIERAQQRLAAEWERLYAREKPPVPRAK
jgi:hypothetical protein